MTDQQSTASRFAKVQATDKYQLVQQIDELNIFRAKAFLYYVNAVLWELAHPAIPGAVPDEGPLALFEAGLKMQLKLQQEIQGGDNG